MSKVSIKDATVRIKPASTMCEFIAELSDLTAMPANVLNIHQLYGGTSSAEQLNTDGAALLKPTLTNDDVAFLKELSVEAAADEDSSSRPIRLADILTITRDDESAAEDDEPADVDDVDADGDEVAAGKTSKTRAKRQKEQRKERQRARARLTLQDLIWLNEVLSERRRHSSSAADGQPAVYLHQLLVGSQLALPRNEIHERDPALEARCVRLRLEQDARVYNAMTKNVDTSRRQLPDDTIAYQSVYFRCYGWTFFFNQIDFSVYSESHQPADDRRRPIPVLGGRWLCVRLHRRRAVDRQSGLWLPAAAGHHLCAGHCAG